MRDFIDDDGIQWTVFEVRREASGVGAKWTYLPAGFGDGWLCFESTGGKRRLGHYPERWRGFTDEQLIELCKQAQPAGPRRFGIEGTSGPSAPDVDAR